MAAALYIYRHQICTWWKWSKNGVTGRLVVTSPSSSLHGPLRAGWTETVIWDQDLDAPRWTDTQSPERRRWGREDVLGPHFSSSMSAFAVAVAVAVACASCGRKQRTNAPHPMHIPSFLPSLLPSFLPRTSTYSPSTSSLCEQSRSDSRNYMLLWTRTYHIFENGGSLVH